MPPRVLLAEDNSSLATALTRFLTGQGMEVVPVGSGTEAERLLQTDRFDLLVLDVKLPGATGVDLLKRVRSTSSLAALPVILMSGIYKGDRYLEAARRLGVACYLEKPFSGAVFLEAVTSSLRSAVSPAAAAATPPPTPPPDPAPHHPFHLLAKVHLEGNNGIMLLSGGQKIHFLGGDPVSFETRGRNDFGSFLLTRGKISLQAVKEFVGQNCGRIFFTEAGLLTLDELQEESRLFLVRSILDSLASGGAARFVPASLSPEPPLTPVPSLRLLYEAGTGKTVFDAQTFVARNGDLYPARTSLFFRKANLVPMRAADIALLQRMDGGRSLNQILQHDSGAAEGAPFFHFLLSCRMISFYTVPAKEAVPDFPQKLLFNRPLEEVHDESEATVDFIDVVEEFSDSIQLVAEEEPASRERSGNEEDFEQVVQKDHSFIQGKNYYEIFGLSQGSFSFNSLKEAYFSKTRQYAPDRFMELSGASLPIAQEVLSHYANAYSTLSNVVAKERYDEMLNAGVTKGLDGKQDDKLQARVQFESGSVFLEMHEYANAEKALQEAYVLEPEKPLHMAMYAWAIYRNPANKNSRSAFEKARTLLGKSVLSGKTAEAFAFRGWMLFEEGREGLAESEFAKALKINPRHALASKGLKAIEERREADRKGIFKKMFR